MVTHTDPDCIRVLVSPEHSSGPFSTGDEGSTALRQQLHGAAREIMLLRTRLARSQDQLEVSKAAEVQLNAILSSRGFKLVQALYGAWAFAFPRGSYRERLRAGLAATRRAASVARLAWPGRADPAVEPTPADGSPEPAGSIVTAMRLPEQLPNPERAAKQIRLDSPGFAVSGNFRDRAVRPASLRIREAPGNEDTLINLILLSITHRSGSTLLQRICNARKKTLIWGEHGGVLTSFAQVFEKLVHFSVHSYNQRLKYFGGGEDPNVWMADMSPDLDYVEQAIVDSARALLSSLYGQSRETHDLIGFKEVQYRRSEAELLRRCYPRAEILLLVRHPCKTWNSTPRHWHPSFESFVLGWAMNARSFIRLAQIDPHCHLVRHEDVVAQEPRTMELLCDVARLTREEIQGVLAHKIGSIKAGISAEEREKILERCREPMGWLGYA